MSWCPKCKNEYRAGITVCPDCNEELLEELTEEVTLEFVPVFQTTDEELKEKIMKYLAHCGHKVQEESGMVETEEGETITAFAVLVPKDSFAEAMQEIRTVLTYEAKKEAGEEDLKPRNHAPEPSAVYVDAKARYQEYKSSGIMFLVFAALFLVFGILNIVGVINIMASTVSLILIFAAVIGFTYVGITSLMKISSLKEEVSTEEQTTDTIMDYLKENFTKEKLLHYADDDTSGELLYFQLMEEMKKQVTEAFPEADENYLEALLEDYYNSLDL